MNNKRATLISRLERQAQLQRCAPEELLERWLVRDAQDTLPFPTEAPLDGSPNTLAVDKLAYSAALIQSSEDAIIGKTLEGIIVSWNPGAEKIYGYTAVDVIGKPISILIPPGRYDEVPNIIRRVREGEVIQHYETIRIRKDGTPLNIALTISPIRNVSNAIIGASVIARDITQQKLAEQTLRESERFARATVDALSALIAIIDAKGTILTVNRAWQKRAQEYGIAPDYQWEGKDYLSICDRAANTNADAALIARGIRAVIGGASESFEHEYECHTPTEEAWYIARVTRFSADEPACAVVAHENITQRKRYENALRTSEERLRLVTDNVRDMILLVDEKAQIQYASPSSRTVWGIEPQTLVGTRLSDWLPFVHEEDRETFQSILNNRLATGSGPAQWSYRFQDAPRQYRWKESAVNSFQRQDGTLAGFVYAIRDVHERSLANENLQKANERFLKAFHGNPLSICISTLAEGRFIDVNPAFIETFGFTSRDDVIGKTSAELETWHGLEEHPAVLQALSKVGQKPPFYYPFRHQLGQTREALCDVEIIELSGEECILSMFQDITDQRRTEHELALYQQHLELLVTARTAELEQLNEELQEQVIERHLAEVAEREQRILAEALCNIAVALNQKYDLDALLDEIVLNVGYVVAYDAVGIMLLDGETVKVMRVQGDLGCHLLRSGAGLALGDLPFLAHLYRTQEPIFLADEAGEAIEAVLGQKSDIHAFIGTPMIHRGEVIGFVCLCGASAGRFANLSLHRLNMFIEQATVAINNVQLNKQNREIAILRERQQIARDLHDAITQTMFSASIVAETLLKYQHLETPKVAEGLFQLHRLTRGAVAEARTLLFELRPEALADAKLHPLLTQLAHAFEGKTGIRPTIRVPAEVTVPQEVSVAFYWITHEALHNIEKHARASAVTLEIEQHENAVLFRISDNGRGFMVNATNSTQLGLRILRERAEAIQAALHIESAPNRGTVLTIHWKDRAR